MNKTTFRFITLLGIVVMFFGGAGSMAAQSGSGSYPWVGAEVMEVGDENMLRRALIDDENAGKVIRLMNDIDLLYEFDWSINATIDFYGHTIKSTVADVLINVTSGVVMNIYNSKESYSTKVNMQAKKDAIHVYYGATLNIYGGIFVGEGSGMGIMNLETTNVYGGTFISFKYDIENSSTLTIEGGTFKGDNSGTGVYNSGTVTVKGGTFENLEKGIDNADAGTLHINGGTFVGNKSGTGVHNSGSVHVNDGTFEGLNKGIDNTRSVFINGGTFKGNGSGTGVYNGKDVYVKGGTFEGLDMGIYNTDYLYLNAMPTVGTGNSANKTADIGLAARKVIEFDWEISSLPANYVKMKVGQFSYDANSGYSPAGSAPYVVTSGYKNYVKGIHPAQMFQAYDPIPSDNEYYEVCAKSGSGTDVGEAQIVKVDGNDVTWTNPDNSGGEGPIINVLKHIQEWADGAVIRLNRNVDIGEEQLSPSTENGRTSFTLDLNGHLLTGSPGNFGLLYNNGLNVTICDSGEGGMIAVNSGNRKSAVYNDQGSLTIKGGSFFSEGAAINSEKGTLTVSGGTFTGGGNAVFYGSDGTATISGGTFTGGDHAVSNAGGGTATISGGTFIGSTAGSIAISNNGTMELGCGSDEVKVLGGGEADAVTNNGALTVGSNVSITSGDAAGIFNPGTLTVAGFPTFDQNNACDIRLLQASDGSNTLISFSGDITAAPANPIKIKITDIYWNAVTPGENGYILTSGYAAHVKRGGSGADKDRPRDPGEVFTVVGVADGADLGLKGGEAVAFAGGVPVAAVKIGSASFIFGTGAEQYATATEALMRAVDYSTFIEDNVTVKMLLDVDLGSEYLRFVNNYDVASIDPARQGVMTLDLGGCQLAGLNTCLVSNSALSLTLTDTDGGGAIVSYSGVCSAIENNGGLTVKSVTLSASGSGNKCIYNKGTLTIDGAPTFETSGGAVDVYLDDGKTIGIGDKFALSEGHKITVAGDFDNPVKLTSGYGSRMRYPAGDANAGKVKAPGEVFAIADVDTKALVFAGGEAWVVESGTKALVETGGSVIGCSSAGMLTIVVRDQTADVTVMLTDNVIFENDNSSWRIPANGKNITLDLGGHGLSGTGSQIIEVLSNSSLDITDSGYGGTISNTVPGQSAIIVNGGSLSVAGGVTFDALNLAGIGIVVQTGTLTLKGWPTFENDGNAFCNIWLNENQTITFTNDITEAPAKPIILQYNNNKLGTFTSGYGAHVTYPAGHTNAGNPIDPEEVFTYKPYGTLVASVHPRLVDDNDAVEAAFWMPKMTVAYVDAAGTLHDDLTGSTPSDADDGHEAYILDGTETLLGSDGQTTWYVCKTPATANDGAGLSYTQKLTLIGTVHLILADGCKMSVGTAANALSDHAIYQGSGAFTIFGQTNGSGTLGVYGTEAGINCNGSDLTINGGTVDVNATKSGILANTTSVTINDGKVSIVGSTTDGISSHNNPIAITGGKVSVIGGSHGIVNGMESITLGWRHYDDYIYATNYNALGGISIDDGQYMMACDAVDGSGTAFTGTLDATDIAAINGKYLRPAMYTITAPQDVTLSVADNVGTKDPVTIGSGDNAKTYYLYSPDNTVTASLKNETFVTNYLINNTGGAPANVDIVGVGSASGVEGVNAFAFTMTDQDLKIFNNGLRLPTTGGKYLAFVDNNANVKTDDDDVVILVFLGLEKNTTTGAIEACFTEVSEVPEDLPVIFANADGDSNLPATIGVDEDNSASANALAATIRADASPIFMTGTAGQTIADVLSDALSGVEAKTLVDDVPHQMSLDAADYVFFLFNVDKFVPVAASASSTLSGRRYLLAVDKVTLLKLLNDSGSGSAARSLSSTAAARSASATDRIWAFPLMIGSNDTGITNLTLDSDGSTNGWYTIDGRRLDSRPTTKGVYIRNGHKEVVR